MLGYRALNLEGADWYKSNFWLLGVVLVVCMDRITAIGWLCRSTHCQDVPRGAK